MSGWQAPQTLPECYSLQGKNGRGDGKREQCKACTIREGLNVCIMYVCGRVGFAANLDRPWPGGLKIPVARPPHNSPSSWQRHCRLGTDDVLLCFSAETDQFLQYARDDAKSQLRATYTSSRTRNARKSSLVGRRSSTDRPSMWSDIKGFRANLASNGPLSIRMISAIFDKNSKCCSQPRDPSSPQENGGTPAKHDCVSSLFPHSTDRKARLARYRRIER